ncbi:hypothetical protein IY145_23555 [Methylosinus sp. H3A]|uniref:hypothetical protein n=1 Tax=Methylosinus sp. H3A TaxID=2785786 RepID=UPI0018C2432C|nr:hypothetical protein [Methylosinus sp. H3A]MBG0812326.1 hypothetical protein [Methylosinus sp. H3A]
MHGEKKSKLPNGFVWRNVTVERAADALLEEHGADALKQARLGKAAGRRQRSRSIYNYWEEVERLLVARAARAEAAEEV